MCQEQECTVKFGFSPKNEEEVFLHEFFFFAKEQQGALVDHDDTISSSRALSSMHSYLITVGPWTRVTYLGMTSRLKTYEYERNFKIQKRSIFA